LYSILPKEVKCKPVLLRLSLAGNLEKHVSLWDRMEGAWLWTLLGWICLFGVAVSGSNRPFMNKKCLKTLFVFVVAYLPGGDSVQFLATAVIGHHTFTIKDRGETGEGARIFKRLWSPGIDSKEAILPAYGSRRADAITLLVLGS
jgi:hypothetical protein